jgi:hypothetical protein
MFAKLSEEYQNPNSYNEIATDAIQTKSKYSYLDYELLSL